MSAICQHVESAIVRWMAQSAGEQNLLANSFALATNASRVEVIPTGLLVTHGDKASFRLNFYSGESEEKVELPAVVVTCQSGQRMDDAPNIQTCEVDMTLEVQCDSKDGFDSVEWLDQASRWMHGQLSGTTNVERELEIADPALVVSYVSNPEVGRAAEGRRRIHRWAFQVVASI